MVPGNEKLIPLVQTITVSNGSTHIGAVDTKGYDYLKFNVSCKSGSAAETAVATLSVCESDSTLPTAYTDGDAVTALVGAAAVSTSAGFVLPARSSTTDNTYRLNVDLKGRKRYVAVYFAPTLTVTNGSICINAELARAEDGGDIAAIGTATAGTRVIVSG